MQYRLISLEENGKNGRVPVYAERSVGTLAFADGRVVIDTKDEPLRIRIEDIFSQGTTIEGTGSSWQDGVGAQTVVRLSPGDPGFDVHLSAMLFGTYQAVPN